MSRLLGSRSRRAGWVNLGGSDSGRRLDLAGIDFSDKSLDEMKKLLRKTLSNKINGICFSPYVGDQGPGDKISPEQISERLDIIKDSTEWIRTFSCTDGNEEIPVIAKKKGLRVLCGAWLGKNREINEAEINNAIRLANEGYADIVAVGNEVLLREDLTEDELIDYIKRVKEAVPKNVPVGYVDAYYEFGDHPRVSEVCDVILANCYPFWEGCSLEDSFLYMKDMFRRALMAGRGKQVIITETGWPNKGSDVWGAVPSEENAIKYFLNTYRWAEEEDIHIFYFSTFDEVWKLGHEGDVGAYWGLWDKDGELKY